MLPISVIVVMVVFVRIDLGTLYRVLRTKWRMLISFVGSLFITFRVSD